MFPQNDRKKIRENEEQAMSWLGESEYECPNCDGEGEYPCECCGNETECPECKGSGWDAEKIDLDAYLKAVDELGSKSRAGQGTSEWIEDGKRLGRRLCVWDGEKYINLETVRVSDYAFKDDEDDEDETDPEAIASVEEAKPERFVEAIGQKHFFEEQA
jgi:hypothetical protein